MLKFFFSYVIFRKLKHTEDTVALTSKGTQIFLLKYNRKRCIVCRGIIFIIKLWRNKLISEVSQFDAMTCAVLARGDIF